MKRELMSYDFCSEYLNIAVKLFNGTWLGVNERIHFSGTERTYYQFIFSYCCYFAEDWITSSYVLLGHCLRWSAETQACLNLRKDQRAEIARPLGQWHDTVSESFLTGQCRFSTTVSLRWSDSTPFSPEPSVFSVAVNNLKIRICKTIILPVVLYGCEAQSLTLREGHRLGSVWKQGAEEDIWTEERWGDRRMEKTA
jgi:hypothetical protein